MSKVDWEKYAVTEKMEPESIPENTDWTQYASPEKKQSLYDKFQEFMNPKKVDSSGNAMVETFLGRMPREPQEFKSGTPQNMELQNELISAGAGMPGIKNIAQGVSGLSLKNVMKKILEQKNKEKIYHSTQYNKIWKLAKDSGLEKVNLDPKLVGLPILKATKVEGKYTRPLEELMENPTVENAQKAQSDLGKFINDKQLNKAVLTSEESAAKNAAIKAQEHIKDMMFRDAEGNLNKELKDAYTKVSESYGKNYKPYDIPALKKYEAGKRTAKQTLSSLKSGSFMAEKGAMHPEIEKREMIIDLLKNAGIPISSAAAGITAGGYLMKKLLGKND